VSRLSGIDFHRSLQENSADDDDNARRLLAALLARSLARAPVVAMETADKIEIAQETRHRAAAAAAVAAN